MAETFYVTTPIYYVNARPHIGHAYTTIFADVLARRHRLLGDDTRFLTGTDEHGQKIERAAAAAGVPPQAYADEVSASFRTLWKRMGITNDQYIRTTDEAHKRGVQKLFVELYAKGQIYLSSYTGQYSIGEEMFVEGPPGTIGPDGKPTETVTEENFFFRLGNYQLRLLDLIESDELRVSPESRKNEVLSFLLGSVKSHVDTYVESYFNNGGPTGSVSEDDLRQIAFDALPRTAKGTKYIPGALKDLSVSRSSFTWGIPVPEPAASEAREKHVIYVWLDALANYITALGYGSGDETNFQKYWPADLHLVGKEIIRFHCVYWPAFLMAAGLPLPKAITAHGWLLFDDAKMSKSKGNVVRTETILDAFGSLCPQPPATASPADRDLFAADVLRYFLLREIPFGQDGSFTFEALITRYNADLANGYGNLVSRVLKLLQTSFSGVIPPSPIAENLAELRSNGLGADFAYLVGARTPFDQVGSRPEDNAAFQEWVGIPDIPPVVSRSAFYLQTTQFGKAIEQVLQLVTQTDTFMSEQAPWKLAKDPQQATRLALVLYTAAEAIRISTAMLYPILPFATANVWHQLGLGDIEAAAKNGELTNLQWGGLKPGTKLGRLGPIFPRADKGLAQTMIDMEAANAKPNTPEAANAAADATTSTATEFKETSLASETLAPTDPAAGPRTASLVEPNPGELVAGSAAVTTERPGTPGHAEAQASGIFSGTAGASQPADRSPQITIDDFAKVELRVAKVLVCERIPKADKLLRLEVDLGYEKRQILSGIAEWYTPEDLIGRRIVVITNLAPRKMRGLESHGMLLAGSAEGGKPALATFADTDDLPLGSRLK